MSMSNFVFMLWCLQVVQSFEESDEVEVKNLPAMDRIIGGTLVDIRDHPYQVALVKERNDRRRILCGGALVKPKVVFTAAHCTHIKDGTVRPNLSVLIGANSLSDPEGKTHSIKKIIKHPDFTFMKFDNDFSIILLKTPAQYSSKVQSIPISHEDLEGGTVATTSGWGVTEFGIPSHNLRSVDLKLESRSKCQDHFPKPFHPKITSSMICVKPDLKTTYYGDSGSPLVVDGKLVGLVSFGRTVGDKKKTTVFSKVRSFLHFVEDEVPEFNSSFNE